MNKHPKPRTAKSPAVPSCSPALLDLAPAPQGWNHARDYLKSLTPDRAATVWQALLVELMDDLLSQSPEDRDKNDYTIRAFAGLLRTIHIKLLTAPRPANREALRETHTIAPVYTVSRRAGVNRR